MVLTVAALWIASFAPASNGLARLGRERARFDSLDVWRWAWGGGAGSRPGLFTTGTKAFGRTSSHPADIKLSTSIAKTPRPFGAGRFASGFLPREGGFMTNPPQLMLRVAKTHNLPGAYVRNSSFQHHLPLVRVMVTTTGGTISFTDSSFDSGPPSPLAAPRSAGAARCPVGPRGRRYRGRSGPRRPPSLR